MTTAEPGARTSWWAAGGVVLLAAAALLVDLRFDAALAAAVPYVVVVALAVLVSSSRFTILTAVVCTVLIVGGLYLAPPDARSAEDTASRAVAVLALWVVAGLGPRCWTLLRSGRRMRNQALELETIFKAFPDVAFRMNREGKILAYYAGRESVLYLPPDKFLGRRMPDVMPKDIATQFDRALARLARRTNMTSFEYALRIDGRERHWEARLLSLPDDDVFAIVRDTTRQKNLEREILEAARREQMTIGQEIHDGVGQDVRGLGYLAKSLARRLARSEAPEAPDAAKLAEGMQDVLGQLRALAKGLIPVEVKAEGLMVALQDLACTAQQRYGRTCEFVCPRPVLVVEDHVALHLFRIAQEALNNSVRHSSAERITVSLEVLNGQLVLEIRDDGTGLGEISGESRGLGMRTMQYRASLIGATYSTLTPVEGGTIVRCSLDYDESNLPLESPPA